MSDHALDLLPDEVGLVREYDRIRRHLPAEEARLPKADPRGDVDLEGPAPILYRTPSGEETEAEWLKRYPSLALTELLRLRLGPLRLQLLEAISRLPEPPRGRVHREVVEAQASAVRRLARSVSWYARLTHAVAGLRGLVAHATGEEDPTPVDPYEIGGTVLYHKDYYRYDRWRVRVARLSPAVRKKEREYDRDRREKRRGYMREYMRVRRSRKREGST